MLMSNTLLITIFARKASYSRVFEVKCPSKPFLGTKTTTKLKKLGVRGKLGDGAGLHVIALLDVSHMTIIEAQWPP